MRESWSWQKKRKQRKEAEDTPHKQLQTRTTPMTYIAFLANTPAQSETQLHSLERAAAGIGLHVNAHKTEYMCINQRADISTQNGSNLKLVWSFNYVGSSVSSIKTDINTGLAMAWTAIDRLLVIWKSDQTDKIKRIFFSSSGRVDTPVWMHYMDANLTYGEKAWR